MFPYNPGPIPLHLQQTAMAVLQVLAGANEPLLGIQSSPHVPFAAPPPNTFPPNPSPTSPGAVFVSHRPGVCENGPPTPSVQDPESSIPHYTSLAGTLFPLAHPPNAVFFGPSSTPSSSSLPPMAAPTTLRRSVSDTALANCGSMQQAPVVSPRLPQQLTLTAGLEQQPPYNNHTLSSYNQPPPPLHTTSSTVHPNLLAFPQLPVAALSSHPKLSEALTPPSSYQPSSSQLDTTSAWDKPLTFNLFPSSQVKLPSAMPSPSWEAGDPCLDFTSAMEDAALSSFNFAAIG